MNLVLAAAAFLFALVVGPVALGVLLSASKQMGRLASPVPVTYQLLVAVGREANVTGFGLEELGVPLAKGGTDS